MSLHHAMRLALRVEGDFWIAYLAQSDSMDGALRLGSLHMEFATQEPLKVAFMDIMRDSVAHALSKMGTGVTGWGGPVPAPDHERGGRA